MKKLIVVLLLLSLSGCSAMFTKPAAKVEATSHAEAMELVEYLREQQSIKSVNVSTSTSRSGAETVKIKVELYETEHIERF